MAQKTITQLVDDLGGGEATQIITFSCGNAQNRIDLSDENVDKMVKGIDSCISKARKTAVDTPGPRPPLVASEPTLLGFGFGHTPTVTKSATVDASRFLLSTRTTLADGLHRY